MNENKESAWCSCLPSDIKVYSTQLKKTLKNPIKGKHKAGAAYKAQWCFISSAFPLQHKQADVQSEHRDQLTYGHQVLGNYYLYDNTQ